MANQPFDTTIINPLERPKSSDINAAQSEIHRDLRDYLFRYFATSDGPNVLTATAQTGFVGRGFVVEQTSPVSMNVLIGQGLGFQATLDTTSNVGGLVGLNDLSYYKPLLLSGSKLVTVPTAPAAGFCRRDMIEVRYNRSLTDLTASDVYSVASGIFTAQNINKTMTFDLLNASIQTIPAGSPTAATSSIVYRVGTEVPYSTDDDFLAAPIPSTDSGYIRLAVINVWPNATFINTGSIADWRPLLSTNKQFNIVGSATLGGGNNTTAPYSDPIISNLSLQVPTGVRACLSHPVGGGGGEYNEYTLTVIGLADATDITGFFTNANILTTRAGITYGYPVSIATLSRTTGVDVTDAMQSEFLSSARTSPNMLVAVGQKVQRIRFVIGYSYFDGTEIRFVSGDATYSSASPSGQDTIDVGFNIKVTV